MENLTVETSFVGFRVLTVTYKYMYDYQYLYGSWNGLVTNQIMHVQPSKKYAIARSSESWLLGYTADFGVRIAHRN